MLAALGLSMVLGVFLLGLGVLLLTLRGAWRAKREPARSEQPVPVPPAPLPAKQSGGLVRQVSDADIELEIRSGRVVNAIQLYREKTGVGPQEARSAVEAWRNRLDAS
jgi:ribosomal protein L7/L12